jgi:Helix-turn-helix domain
VSYRHINYVRDHSKTKGRAKFLLLVIATRTDDEGCAFPSYKILRGDTGLSTSSIQRALSEIPNTELEIIEKGRSEKGQQRRTTKYRILVPDRSQDEHSVRTTVVNMRTVEDNNRSQDDHSTVFKNPTTVVKNAPDYGHPGYLTVNNSQRTVSEQSKGGDAPKRKARKLAGDVSALILPLFLDRPEFRKALEDWQVHKQAKRDPLTQRALELIVTDCEKWGLEKSIEYIHHAIKTGWKGIYEPDSSARNNGNIRPKSEGSPKPSQEDLLSRQPEAVRKAIKEEGNL